MHLNNTRRKAQKKAPVKRSILIALFLFLTLAAPIAAQSTATAIAPGSSLTVSCSTGMTVAIVDTHTLTIACAPSTGATATPTRTPVAAATPTRTPVASATALPTPGSPPISSGIWTSAAELASKPMSGAAWQAVKAAADGSLGSPNIADQDSKHDTNTLAVALVYARTGLAPYRAKASAAILSAIGTEAGGRTLALGRNLSGYVIAADLIDLRSYDPAGDSRFRAWLSSVRRANLDGKTLISTHEDRPNNWGTHAGASRVAADVYLGDNADLARAILVYRGWLGDRGAYAGFDYGDLDWQSSPGAPVGINPAGATIAGHPVGGVLPDDQRRGGGFSWPPPKENYIYEGLQGAIVTAEMLHRAGYPAYGYSNQAILRAYQWLHTEANFPAEGDDTWQMWIVNHRYGTAYPAGDGVGKNMGYANWVFGR
jgi:hypothetical protein